MTDRNFEVRKREHESDIQFNHTETALYRFLDEGIKIIFNYSKFCFVTNFCHRSIIMYTFEEKKMKKYCSYEKRFIPYCNASPGCNFSDTDKLKTYT